MSVGSTDDPEHETADGVWMTKAQLALVRRITVASADRLIRRQHWRKEPGNDGRARVLVPRTWAERPADDPTDDAAGDAADPTDTTPESDENPTDIRRAISFLETTVAMLQEQLGREKLLSDEARQGRAAAEARADKADSRADDLRAARELDLAQLRELSAEITRLRAAADEAAARARGGFLARLLGRRG